MLVGGTVRDSELQEDPQQCFTVKLLDVPQAASLGYLFLIFLPSSINCCFFHLIVIDISVIMIWLWTPSEARSKSNILFY